MAFLPQLSGGVPKGYLRILVFNQDSALIDQRTLQLTRDALGHYEVLHDTLSIRHDGYVTVYVGNESAADVYFDELRIEHRQGLQVQENEYDPWGMGLVGVNYSSPSLRWLNQYQFNGKERQLELGLGWLDYGARFYDPARGPIWFGVDLLADKMRRWSPYTFSFNNAIRFLDPDGMSVVNFDKDGNFLNIQKDNWFHNFFVGYKGKILDDKGSSLQTFRFADPKNDMKAIRAGSIESVTFVKDKEINSMLASAGAFNRENKAYNIPSESRYDFIKEAGKGGGAFDFSFTGIPSMYPGKASMAPNSEKAPPKTLFLVGGIAHNQQNFGNFLFGAGGASIGLSITELQGGAHYNSLFNPRSNGYLPQPDSQDDQYSIGLGYNYALLRGLDKRQGSVTVEPLEQTK